MCGKILVSTQTLLKLHCAWRDLLVVYALVIIV